METTNNEMDLLDGLDSWSRFILNNRRTFTCSTAMTADAREVVNVLLNNHEALDLNRMMEVLMPFLTQAIENEKRKSAAGIAVSSTDWDSWISRLNQGEIELNRQFIPEVWRWSAEERLQAEISFAQECKELSPDITLSSLTEGDINE